ncbi:hypothetical protein [Streptomyces sp. NPDC005423]|uniref:hypothetical protein n=1 Tax=Streptomyces sp. NPDC005423 TaxID=3155343 RepID=UPI0033A0F507
MRESDVLAATKRFSQWKLEDLARECNVGFPFLRQVFALFENGEHRVSRGEFSERFSAIHADLHETYSAYTEHLTAQAMVAALFAVLIEEVDRVMQRLLRHLGRSGPPVNVREDTRLALSALRGQDHVLTGAGENVEAQVRSAVTLLATLADHLTSEGYDSEARTLRLADGEGCQGASGPLVLGWRSRAGAVLGWPTSDPHIHRWQLLVRHSASTCERMKQTPRR